VLALCAYFSLADAVAIKAGIWRFDNTSLTGFMLGPVSVEEILFYLLTAAMVVQGFVLVRGGVAYRVDRPGKPSFAMFYERPTTATMWA